MFELAFDSGESAERGGVSVHHQDTTLAGLALPQNIVSVFHGLLCDRNKPVHPRVVFGTHFPSHEFLGAFATNFGSVTEGDYPAQSRPVAVTALPVSFVVLNLGYCQVLRVRHTENITDPYDNKQQENPRF